MVNVRDYDVVVVGGGIVGLSTAMALIKAYPKTRIVVLEKEPDIALHQTGHNSGVIHAGLYYRPGSQKAGFSVNGGKKLRNFCDENDISYELVGKVVVATSDAVIPALENRPMCVYRSTCRDRAVCTGCAGYSMSCHRDRGLFQGCPCLFFHYAGASSHAGFRDTSY